MQHVAELCIWVFVLVMRGFLPVCVPPPLPLHYKDHCCLLLPSHTSLATQWVVTGVMTKHWAFSLQQTWTINTRIIMLLLLSQRLLKIINEQTKKGSCSDDSVVAQHSQHCSVQYVIINDLIWLNLHKVMPKPSPDESSTQPWYREG